MKALLAALAFFSGTAMACAGGATKDAAASPAKPPMALARSAPAPVPLAAKPAPKPAIQPVAPPAIASRSTSS
jgi:hypothetical protein